MSIPVAVVTKYHYGFAPPDYRLLDVAGATVVTFTTAQAA